MTFSVSDLISALAFGLIVGFFAVSGFNSQHKGENPGALTALQQRMGALYNIAMYGSIGLPMVVVALLSSALRGEPSLADLVILIILIGLAMLASFTLLGNVMKLLGERMPSGQQG